MRLLIVEDDEVIGERLRTALGKEGFRVDLATDGQEGLELAASHPYRLILLDLMLPKVGGLAICERLRQARQNVPILMITARSEIADRVRGLDAGADDYLPKPFAFSELMARIRALLRRDQLHRTTTLKVADLEIDAAHHTVKRSGEIVRLTPREFSLLEALARNEGRTLTRDAIIERVWGDDESLSNTVNFHVTALRKKLDQGRDRSLIETVHGLGYRLRTEKG